MDQRPFRSKGNLNQFHMNTNKLTNTKAAILQVPIGFSGEEIQIVESDVRLPLHYTPAVGSFITEPVTRGRVRINWWGLDLATQKIVISLDVSICHENETCDEWLGQNPKWRIAEDPILTVIPKDDIPKNEDESWEADN